MNPANWGPLQIILILVIVVLLFGSKKIPDLARSLGKAKGEFKKGVEDGEDESKKPAKKKPTKKKAHADKGDAKK